MTVFAQMNELERQYIIEKHAFLTDQCKSRLISRFSDIEGEVDESAKAYAEELKSEFNHENVDWDSFQGRLNNKVLTHYFLLRDMRKVTIIALTAAIYHNWDKSLRGWLTKELSFSFEKEYVQQRWGDSISKLTKLFQENGWDVAETPDMKKILVMHDVVNAYKHGDGRSFQTVRKNHPDYLDDYIIESHGPGGRGFTPRYDNLNVTEEQFDNFAEAITGFWESVPKEILCEEKS